MKVLMILLATLVAMPAAHAGNAGPTMAALTTEAAETRYLNLICARVQGEWKAYTEAGHALRQAVEDHDIAASNEGVAETEVHQRLLNKALGELDEASGVATAKHGRLPKGFKPCPLPTN